MCSGAAEHSYSFCWAPRAADAAEVSFCSAPRAQSQLNSCFAGPHVRARAQRNTRTRSAGPNVLRCSDAAEVSFCWAPRARAQRNTRTPSAGPNVLRRRISLVLLGPTCSGAAELSFCWVPPPTCSDAAELSFCLAPRAQTQQNSRSVAGPNVLRRSKTLVLLGPTCSDAAEVSI